jgi:S-DNA-T family DNA segregation ATPase FtsK/SpoIIIE
MESRIKDEIKGILAILAGLVVFISLISHSPWDQSFFTNSQKLQNMLGSFGSNLSDILLQSIGHASYLIPAVLAITGVKRVFARSGHHNRVVFSVAFIFLIVATSSLLTLYYGKPAGGMFGEFSSDLTIKLFSTIGSYLIFITLMLVSLMYTIQFSLISLAGSVKSKISLASRAWAYIKSKKKTRAERSEPEFPDFDEEEAEPEQEPLPLTYPEIRTRPQQKTVARPVKKVSGDYELPGTDLLNDPPPSISKPSKEELIDRSDLLEAKLRDYSIEGKVTYVSPGPIVTMFEFEPAPGIKINKIVSLADDLAMALKASSIRISPIHGRSTLGIEVPNKNRESVFIKDLIANDAFHKNPSKLTIALGKDIFGVPVMTDLAKMPHLLIAGATGSGKSVGMNSIVISMLYKATPKEVKMLMIDPKMLELSAYEEIPHLLMPVITLPKEASNALKKMVFEMERRYRLLADSGGFPIL